jgi:hypothetical protein
VAAAFPDRFAFAAGTSPACVADATQARAAAMCASDGAPWVSSSSSSQRSRDAIRRWRSSSSATARWASAETFNRAVRACSSRSSGRLMFRRAIHTPYTRGSTVVRSVVSGGRFVDAQVHLAEAVDLAALDGWSERPSRPGVEQRPPLVVRSQESRHERSST